MPSSVRNLIIIVILYALSWKFGPVVQIVAAWGMGIVFLFYIALIIIRQYQNSKVLKWNKAVNDMQLLLSKRMLIQTEIAGLKILEMARKSFPSYPLYEAAALYSLSSVYADLGNFPKAISSVKQAYAINSNKFGLRSKQAVEILDSWAFLRSEEKLDVEAETLLKKALAAHQEAFGKDESIIPILSKLGDF